MSGDIIRLIVRYVTCLTKGEPLLMGICSARMLQSNHVIKTGSASWPLDYFWGNLIVYRFLCLHQSCLNVVEDCTTASATVLLLRSVPVTWEGRTQSWFWRQTCGNSFLVKNLEFQHGDTVKPMHTVCNNSYKHHFIPSGKCNFRGHSSWFFQLGSRTFPLPSTTGIQYDITG